MDLHDCCLGAQRHVALSEKISQTFAARTFGTELLRDLSIKMADADDS